MASLTTAGERRSMTRRALRWVVITIAVWAAWRAAQGILAHYGPAVAPVLIAVATGVAVMRATRYDAEQQAGPGGMAVKAASGTAAGGVVWATWYAWRSLAIDPVAGWGDGVVAIAGVVAVAVIGIALRLRLRDHAPTAPAVIATEAVDVAWDADRSRVIVGLGSATLAGAGAAWAGHAWGVYVPLIAVAAVIGIGWRTARARGRMRQNVSGALCGVLSGGAWTPAYEAAGTSPVKVLWSDNREAPTHVTAKLPPKWSIASVETLETEVTARLAAFGRYVVRADAGARKITAELVPELPTRLRYDGRAAVDGATVWLGTGQATRKHAEAPGSLGVANGELLDFTWNLRVEPHGIAVGTTGAGKSQTVQLIMMQLALAGWKMILIDPKRVEFSQWAGRPGVLRVSTELADHAAALAEVCAEMDSRYRLMTERGVNHVDLLPQDARPSRLLVVVDEIVELMSRQTGKSDAAVEANAHIDAISDAIGSILRLGRSASIHLLAAGQRADRSLVTGQWQANLAFKAVQGAAEQIERNMIGLGDVIARAGIAGRAVMRTFALPQTEVQVAYLDLQEDLDKYLPVGKVINPPVVDVRPEDLIPPPVDSQVLALRPEDVISGEWRSRPPAPGGSGTDSDVGPNDTGQQRDDGGPAWSAKHKTYKRTEPLDAGEAEAALNALTGLARVKTEVAELAAEVEHGLRLRERGLGDDLVTPPHLVFAGAPGTGKTTVARILGSRLREVGAVESGHVIEVLASDLVAEHVGGTGPSVVAAFDQAEGGVLFVDEAYSLNQTGGKFGQEAINAIVAEAENRRGRVVVILAGYEADMRRLLRANEGLKSRFPIMINFPDYEPPELVSIARSMVSGRRRQLDDAADAALLDVLTAYRAAVTDGWGNARSVRVLIDAAVRAQAVRLRGFAATDAELVTITAEDLWEGLAKATGGRAVHVGAVAVADDDVVDAEVVDAELVEEDDADGDAWLAEAFSGPGDGDVRGAA